MSRDFLLVNSILFNAKLYPELYQIEIKHSLKWYEPRKLAETLENYSGSWRLFGVLVVHPTSHYLT